MIAKIKKGFSPFIFLLFIFLIPTFSSLLKPGYFPMHDDMQAMRVYEMHKCFLDLQIPCRWVSDMGYGYGYPQFNFYAPLPYYLMEGFHLLGFSFLNSVKIGFAFGLVLGALGMYLLGKSLWGPAGGFISAILYTYAPYKAVDIYVRGAMGELYGMGVIPFVFWSARELIYGRKKAFLWFALSLASLLVSHNITAFITLPILFVWMAFLIIQKNKFSLKISLAPAKNFFLSLLWGLALSAFFILPAYFEKKFVHTETLTQGYFDYLAHFVGIKQLLFNFFWGYGTSELGPYDNISLSVGLIHWIIPIISLLVGIFVYGRTRKLAGIVFFVVLGWIATFMIHPRSIFIWQNIDPLSIIQFPWRFLILATFVFSVAGGSIAIFFPKQRQYNVIYALLIAFVLLFFHSNNFKPSWTIAITDQEKFSGENWRLQQTISIFDYLPIYADFPPTQKAPDQPEIISGNVQIMTWQKGTNWQEGKINVHSEQAEILLQQFYFPGWKVWVDDKVENLTYNNELGLISFSVNSGQHEINARLCDTKIRLIGNALSLSGIIAIPIYIFQKKILS